MCNLAALARISDSTANSTAHASPWLRWRQCPVPLLGTPRQSQIGGVLVQDQLPQATACGWAPYLLLGVSSRTPKLQALWLGLLSCLLELLAMFSVRACCKGGGECRGDGSLGSHGEGCNWDGRDG